jgi:thioredoxin 2
MTMTPILPLTDTTFEPEVLGSLLPVLVLFGAPWCAPCMVQEEALKGFLGRCGPGLRAGQVDVDEAPVLAGRHDIRRIPTLVLFQGGLEVARHEGVMRFQGGELPVSFRPPDSGAAAC